MLLLDATGGAREPRRGGVTPARRCPCASRARRRGRSDGARSCSCRSCSPSACASASGDGREALARALADPPICSSPTSSCRTSTASSARAPARRPALLRAACGAPHQPRRDAETLSRAKALHVHRLLSKEGAVERDLRASSTSCSRNVGRGLVPRACLEAEPRADAHVGRQLTQQRRPERRVDGYGIAIGVEDARDGRAGRLGSTVSAVYS